MPAMSFSLPPSRLVGAHAVPPNRNSQLTTPPSWLLPRFPSVSCNIPYSWEPCTLLSCPHLPTTTPQTPQSHTPELCLQVVLAQTSPRGSKLTTSQGYDPSEDLDLHRATSTSSQSPPKMGMTRGTGKHRAGEEGPISAQVPGRIWKPPGTQRTVQEGRVLGLDSGN